MDLFYILAGGIVGFVIGLTGVGGGSLMTPLLVLGFGIKPAVAVGTDLLYAAITKAGGVFFHQRQRTVDWRVAGALALGSIPSSLLTVYFLEHLQRANSNYEKTMMLTLSVMLILTSAVVFLRNRLLSYLHVSLTKKVSLLAILLTYRGWITVFSGALLGIVVSLSSVGAGAIGSAILFLLYPRKPAINVVGTDLAHAVLLTTVAGLGHLRIGTVDLSLLLGLLAGGLPSIYLGSLIGKNMPDKILRPLIGVILLGLGTTLLYK
ncbi:MAG: sulfite exporter TauE/SafE family protein [Gammaproteobacteria bacterium]